MVRTQEADDLESVRIRLERLEGDPELTLRVRLNPLERQFLVQPLRNLCRKIDDAVRILDTGRDANGRPVTTEQVGQRVWELQAADVEVIMWTGTMARSLSAEGAAELERSLEDLTHLAVLLRGH